MRNMLFVTLLLGGAGVVHAAPGLLAADVVQTTDGSHILQWQTRHPAMRVDIFILGKDGASRTLVGDDLTGGQARISLPETAGPDPRFYVVVDGGPKDPKTDGLDAHARLLPLQNASNFRDLGGYVSEDGRKVRWGLLYRSAAPVLLSEQDLIYLEGLNIKTTVDLRSNEERMLNPSQLMDPDRETVTMDYSLMSLLPEGMDKGVQPPRTGGYGESIVTLAPLYRDVFIRLLKADGAVHYHCSAGQDRTGVVSALILSALGVSRSQILRDYQMSTRLRRPRYEMPPIDPAQHPGNPVAKFFAGAQEKPPQPLYGDDGISLLAATFDMIDERWGSVNGFLHQVIGLTDADIARLKGLYLEQ